MMACSTNNGGKYTVFTAQKQRKHVPLEVTLCMCRHFVQLPQKRGSLTFPNRHGVKAETRWQVLPKFCVEKFHLRTRCNAGERTVGCAHPVRGGQFVSQGNNNDIGVA